MNEPFPNHDVSPAPASAPAWLGHPRGLFSLSSIEMWERFGFNGTKAILVIYLAKHFLFDDEHAYGIFTAFASLAYLTPFIGGLLADRVLGFKRAVRSGVVLSAAGYFILALSGGPPAQQFLEYDGQRYSIEGTHGVGESVSVTTPDDTYDVHADASGGLVLNPRNRGIPTIVLPPARYRMPVERSLVNVYFTYVGLSLVIIGTGFFKPNNSSMAGRLYAPASTLRDAGFNIFYMGLNIGSFLGQLLLPYIRREVGFPAAFAAAGLAMLVAFAISLATDRHFAASDESGNDVRRRRSAGWTVYGVTLIALAPLWLLLQQPVITRQFVYAANGVLFLGLIWYACARLSRSDRNATLLAVTLTLFSVVFWALFEQSASSLTLYADRNTDRTVFGWNMPPDQIQFLNPLFIILLTPGFNLMWALLGRRGWEPDTVLKFALGTLLVAAGFLTLVWGSHFGGAHAQVALGWLAAAYLLHTMGELCVSPVGLSMITLLSAPHLAGVMMGMWFLSGSLAQAVGGVLATLTTSASVGGEVLDPQLSLVHYARVFNAMGWTAVLAAVVLMLARPKLKRWARHA